VDRDLLRQGALLAGAAAQIVSAAAVGDAISEVAGEGESFAQPAPWAFGIWGPIYALAAAGAVDGVLAGRRDAVVPRRLGWPLALAYAGDTAWQLAVPRRRLGTAQVVLVGIAAAATVAQDRAAAVEHGPRGLRSRLPGARPAVTRRDRLLHSVPAGLLAGWTTAANGISLHDLVVTEERVPSRATRQATAAGVFAGLGTAAAARLRAIGGAATAGGTAYGAAVLWALSTAAVEQRRRAPAAAIAALAVTVPVARALAAGRR
jgi:hypothetical protein